MRKHGWQLPYHPLQVVAVSVFLALGFAFYVFFAPFVGKELFQLIVIGIYTPLIISAFGLYIWCAAADPADPGVFKSKKYLKNLDNNKHSQPKDSKGGELTTSIPDANAVAGGEKTSTKNSKNTSALAVTNAEMTGKDSSSQQTGCFSGLLALLPCTSLCNSSEPDESRGQQMSEDGMFYCSLCEVEVFKNSKHCRVCDKCVDCFDHHCRWLNNCIGKRNYRKFFALMVSSLLLLILQWSTGIAVLICCFLERKKFSVKITSNLGSSFTVVPFVIVVVVCTVLAIIATLPLAQLFFFHILLVKKGISTYDYIMALREQEQQGSGVQQSPQMSPMSSITRVSSTSSFNTLQRAAWCTPPRLFVEDQYDVVPTETGSFSSHGRKMGMQETVKKNNKPAVKISPWTLARLNAEEVSKAAAEARKKSKILQPVTRRQAPHPLERESSLGSSSRRLALKPDSSRKRPSNRIRLPADLSFEPMDKVSSEAALTSRLHLLANASSSYAPLQLQARSIFHPNQAMPGIVTSSPESSLDSPDVHPVRISSGAEDGRPFVGLSAPSMAPLPLSRSNSDGYDASGGEDSDRVATRIGERSANWTSLLFQSEHNSRVTKSKTTLMSSNQAYH